MCCISRQVWCCSMGPVWRCLVWLQKNRCHMRRLFWLLHARCVECSFFCFRFFFERQKRKTTIRHQCVCPNTRMKGPLCLWEDDWMGERCCPFSVSLGWPHVWVLQRGADAHRWAVLFLSLSHAHARAHARAFFFSKNFDSVNSERPKAAFNDGVRLNTRQQ